MALVALKFMIQEEVAPKHEFRVFASRRRLHAVARMLNEASPAFESACLNTDVQRSRPRPCEPARHRREGHQRLGAGLRSLVGPPSRARRYGKKSSTYWKAPDMVFVNRRPRRRNRHRSRAVVASLAKETRRPHRRPSSPKAFRVRRTGSAANKPTLGLTKLASVADTSSPFPTISSSTWSQRHQLFRSLPRRRRCSAPGRAGHQRHHHHARPHHRDFSDIRRIMLGMGYAMMGTASATARNAAMVAAERPISCALMEAGGVRGARGVLINIHGIVKLGLPRGQRSCTLIRTPRRTRRADQLRASSLTKRGEEVKITVIATRLRA